MHGYPFADSMRASWFIAGPGIRRGARNDEPCRLVDLTPTMLDMLGFEIEAGEVAGRPLRSIYRPRNATLVAESRPVYWQDVDLAAWDALSYQPVPPFGNMPKTINQPDSPADLNNIAYNALAVSEWNVLRIADDLLTPINGGKRPLVRTVEAADRGVRRSRLPWLSEAAVALNVSEITLGDYSMTSSGNMRRIDGAVNWVQSRTREVEGALAAPLGARRLPASGVVHGTIDTAQSGFWELYRFGQRVLIEVLDENVLSGIENSTDRVINAFDKQPAEIVVEPAGP